MFRWEKMNDLDAFFGDVKDLYGRRVLMIISNGVAVFAHCLIEDYLIMIDDYEKMMGDFEFVFAAKLTSGIPYFSKEVEEMFDTDGLEEITKKMVESL